MPKNKFQEVVLTVMMVCVMVYAMICYNISLSIGGLSNEVFIAAFGEMIIMGPIAFILDFFIVSKLAFKTAFSIVNVKRDNPFMLVLAISTVSVAWMCPLMSLVATIIFKNPGSEFFSVWVQTTAFNLPAAFFWQILYAGPFVRFVFRRISKEEKQVQEQMEM